MLLSLVSSGHHLQCFPPCPRPSSLLSKHWALGTDCEQDRQDSWLCGPFSLKKETSKWFPNSARDATLGHFQGAVAAHSGPPSYLDGVR